MKSVWSLIGEANTRKSSMVRCLLGVGKTGTQVEVQCVSGVVLPIWGMIGAAQERKPVSPEELLRRLNDTNWKNKFEKSEFKKLHSALVPLRYDPDEDPHSAEDYVQALVDDGWTIQGVVSLGEPARDWLKNSGLKYIQVPNSASLPSNAIATQVRTAFGWL